MRQLIVAAATAIGLLAASAAEAQRIDDVVPRDLYTDTLRQNGNSITICYNQRAMTAEFDAALADAIGAVLLVDVKLVDMGDGRIPTHPLDYRLPYLPETLFVLLAEQCDAIMGYVLSRTAPDWVLLTRPYLSTGNLLVTRDAALTSIEDLPLDKKIGSRSLALSDNRLSAFLLSRPAERRWQRFTYYDNQKLLDRLDDGTVAAAVIWEPALYFASKGDPAAKGYRMLPLPFPDRRTEIGLATRSNNTYLNAILGEAIGELIVDGTLRDLIEQYHLGPTSLPQK